MRSTENQADAIRQYAATRGIEIVRTYADAGKSCLKIEGRDALKQLIDDVQSGATDFTMVLVYDASRWGRFQDADESAYYEYICKRAGIAVQYCAEQFENDGSPVSTIVKGVMWIRAPGVFEGIVERDLFDAAHSIINARSFRLSDAEMLEVLHALPHPRGDPAIYRENHGASRSHHHPLCRYR